MLAAGSDLETVDSLSFEDARNLYMMLVSGMWGPYKDYSFAYLNYQAIHENKETQKAIALGTEYKHQPCSSFKEVFPLIFEYLTLGQEPEIPKLSGEQLAKKMGAILIDDNAPIWLKDALKD